MKLEVGMYVRTNTGIHKIFEIDEKKTVWKYKCDRKSTGEWDGSYEYTLLKEEQFIGEPSFDITDLLGAGDYVNGERIQFITNKNELLTDGGYDLLKKYECIKSIVTKEQFESMEYKI